MTRDELRAVKVGDNVTLWRHGKVDEKRTKGRVTQCTRTWFMVMWSDGVPEIVKRVPTIMTDRLELEASHV